MSGETRIGIDIRQFKLGDMLRRQAATFGEKKFIRFFEDEVSLSYREVDARSDRLAAGLAKRSVAKGTHVAMLMENSAEMLLTYFALAKIGAVAVPINTAARGQLLRYFIEHSDSTVLIVDGALADRYAEIEADSKSLTAVILSRPQAVLGIRRPCIAFADLLDETSPPPTVEIAFTDLAALFYTSGTTGPSKGVMFSHVRILTGVAGHLESREYRSDDVLYSCLPMFHSNAMLGTIYIAMMVGACSVIRRRFSASRFWDDIIDNDCTIANLLGSMTNILWTQPASPRDSKNKLRSIALAPMPAFGPAFEERFGLKLLGGYGLTDYGVPTKVDLDQPASKLLSSGNARKGWQVRIVDDDDFDMPSGKTGEIILRCDNAWEGSPGYYKMPEKTLEAWRNFWFHTGDRGYLDADGYLYFVDRKKDALRRRGENISAFEIESVIVAHPSIADVAVFPVKADMLEDEVAAAIVLKPGSTLTPEEMIRHCSANMSYFMVPRYLQFLDELPRTLTQKPQKYQLRQDAEANMALLWDREAAGIKVAR